MTDNPNIAIFGKAGSGKSTAAALLMEHFGYRRLSFAGKHPGGLRDVAMRMWGAEAENDRDKLLALGKAGREIDQDVWVNAALRNLKRARDAGNLTPAVCDDLRFPNEAWALTAEDFVIIRIVAGRHLRIPRLEVTGKVGSDPEWENDESETALDQWPELYRLVNEGTKKELFEQIVMILDRERNVVAT